MDVTEGNAAPVINQTPPPADQPPPDQVGSAGQQAIATTKPPAPPSGQQADMPTLPAASAPNVKFSPKRGGLAGVLDEVRNWIAGTQGTAVAYDTAGNRYVTHPAMTAHQQWAKVGAEAFRGAAAGYAAGRGAGNSGKAAEAGVQAGMDMTEKAQKDQETEAEKGAAAARQARIDTANDHIQGLKIAEQNFRLGRLDIEATEHDTEFQQKQQELFIDKLHGKDLGTYNTNNFQDVVKVHPEFQKIAATDPLSIQQIRMVDPATGKYIGNKFIYVPPDQMKQIVPAGTKFQHWVAPDNPTDPASKGHMEEFEPSDPQTYGDLARNNAATSKAAGDDAERVNKLLTGQKTAEDIQGEKIKNKYADQIAQADIAVKKAQTAKDWTENAKGQQELVNLKMGLKADGTPRADLDPLNAADHDQIVQGMLDHTVDIEKMFGTRSGSPLRAKYVADAKKIDPSFDEGSYKRVQQVITQFASQSGNSPGAQVTGYNMFLGHTGEFLDEMQKLRNDPNMSPLLLKPLNWLKKNMEGDPAITEVYNAMDNMRREQLKFIDGGILTEADKKDLANRIDLNMNAATMEGVAKQMMSAGAVRLGSMNEPYKALVKKNVPTLLNEQSQKVLKQAASGTDPESLSLRNAVSSYIPPEVFTGATAPQQPAQQAAPPRPANVPPNFVYQNGPKGLGWYAPTAGAK